MFCHGAGYGPVGWMGWAAMAFHWIFVIGLIYLAYRLMKGVFDTPSGSSQAIGYLEESYAKGEISREDFLERKKVLKNK